MKYDVCVFGGCALDQTFFEKVGNVYRDIPDVIAPGGKGANQAVAAAKAGAKTVIISRLGNDEIGSKIINNLNYFGVKTTNVEIEDGLANDYSNIYIRLNDKDNDIHRFSGAINSFTPDMVERYKDVLLDSKIVVCQLKIPKEVTEALINFCYENDKFLVLTPCRAEKLVISDPHNLELIDKISLITCNKSECETIFGTTDIESCCRRYPNKLIVTLGADGLMYHDGNGIVKMDAVPTDVVDTTGAGDTLNGNLCAFLSKDMDLPHALRKAMYASAMKIAVKTAQAGMPYIDDLELYIQNCRNQGFAYEKELNLILKEIKYSYDRIRYNDFKIHSKADSTLVTDVDIAIENYLINTIRNSFPNDNFVTEENYPDNNLTNRTWVIDPIDGTSHFIKRDDMWGIQIAFYDKRKTRFSVIYLPGKDELFYGIENKGVYVNNEKVFKLETVPLDQAVVEFGGSIYKRFEEKKACFDRLLDDGKLKISNIISINSCCISYTNLLLGKTDGLIISTNKPWDIMPGEFMCKLLNIPITYLDADKKVRLQTLNNDIKKLITIKKN